MPYIGTSPSNGVRRVHTYTATASQTTFTGASSEGVTLSYVDTNYIDVFQNGVLLGSADYTSTSGTSVVLAQGASADDLIVIVVYDVFSVADTVSKTNGGSFDSAVTMSNNLTVSGAFTSQGIDDNSDATAITIDSSENVGIGTSSMSSFYAKKFVVNVGDEDGITIYNDGANERSYIMFADGTSGDARFAGQISYDHNNDSMIFATGASTRATIDSSGNVGIGEATPSVSGKGIEIYNEGNDTLSSIRLAGNNNTGTPGQKFNCELRFNGGAGSFQIIHYGSVDSLGTERARIDAGGDFYTNDGSVSSLSDRRVKKDITDLQDGLSIVNQLRPVTFKYNGASSMTPDDNKINYGFIADEVQAVASHYVTENTDEINGETVTDFKSLSTGRMIPMLFKAVQELSAKVTALETENATQTTQIADLISRVTALENAE